jgi:hypothetical protein
MLQLATADMDESFDNLSYIGKENSPKKYHPSTFDFFSSDILDRK